MAKSKKKGPPQDPQHPESCDHGRLFERVAKMAEESGMPADCMVNLALDKLAESLEFKGLVEGQKGWRRVLERRTG